MSAYIHFLLGPERWSLPLSAISGTFRIRDVGWRETVEPVRSDVILAAFEGAPLIIEDARRWLETVHGSPQPRWAIVWPYQDGAICRSGIGVCDFLGISAHAQDRACLPARLIRQPQRVEGRVA
jgi:hypothetical protein